MKDVLVTIQQITTPKAARTQLTEQQILTEGAFSRATWDFCVYISKYVTGVLAIIIIFFAWLATAVVFRPIAAVLGFVGDIPKMISILMDEIKKANRIYQAKKELSPEDIKRITDAAKQVYNLMGPRSKSMITRFSNQLTSMNMESPQAQEAAAKMVVALKRVIAAGEKKADTTQESADANGLTEAPPVGATSRPTPEGQVEVIQKGVRVNFHPNYKKTPDAAFPVVFVCDLLSDQSADGSQALFVKLPKVLQSAFPSQATTMWPVTRSKERGMDFVVVPQEGTPSPVSFLRKFMYVGF